MTIAFKNSTITANSNKTSQTSLALTLSAALAVGDAHFIWLACDNSGTSGAKPTCSVTDAGGNTYTLIKDQNRTQASAANDGVYVALFGSIITNGVASGGAVTISFSPTTAAKAYGGFSFTGVQSVSPASSNSSSGSSAAFTSGVSGSVAIGNLVIGLAGAEAATAPSADTDTTNGTWTSFSAGVASGGGGPMAGRCSYKITSGATGTQTYDSSVTSGDWAALIVELVPQLIATITPVTISLTPIAFSESVGGVTASISPVTITDTPIAFGASVGGVTASISPVTMTDTPIALGASVGDVSTSISPALFSLSPVALDYTIPGAFSISPVNISLSPVALTTSVGDAPRSISPVSINLLPTRINRSSGDVSVDVYVSSSSNDGSTNVPGAGDFSDSNASLIAGWDFTARSSWMRFTGFSIPAGATIISAHLIVNLYTGNNAGSLTKIFAEKSATPSNPISNSNYAAKTTTSANVSWVAPSGTSGFASSPDLSAIIQELVNSYGSVSEIVLLHKNDEPSNASRNMRYSSKDDAFGTAPELVVVYNTPADNVSTNINQINLSLTPILLTPSIGSVSRSISPAPLQFSAEVIVGRSGGRPKVWNGSAWVQKPVKVWNGSAWVEKPLKVWTGSTWKLV